MTQQQVSHARTAYGAEASLVDRWVGHLLGTLREAVRLKDSLLVFTWDHVAMMGRQGKLHKREDRLRNQCMPLPPLIHQAKGQGAGERVRGFVQHPDTVPMAPTQRDGRERVRTLRQ